MTGPTSTTPPVTAPAPTAPSPAADLPAPLARLGARHPLVIAAWIVTVVVTLATAGLTLVGYLARLWWVFDISTSYRPQAVLVLAVAIVALAALRAWWLLPVAAICLVLNVVAVAPVYTGHAPAAADGSPTLTIAHLNMQSNHANLNDMQRWLAGHPADIIVVLDTRPEIATAFADGVEGYRMAYPHVQDVPARAASPGKKALDARRQFDPPGAELVVLTNHADVVAQAPTASGLPKSAIEINATIGDQPVSLLGLHTQSPTSPTNHDRRDTQLAAVTSWLLGTHQPAVAFGDFNDTYWSPYFRQLLDRADARSSQPGFGLQATWPVQFRPAGIAIDQSVYRDGVTPIVRERGPSLGSEHRSLIVTYALTGS